MKSLGYTLKIATYTQLDFSGQIEELSARLRGGINREAKNDRLVYNRIAIINKS